MTEFLQSEFLTYSKCGSKTWNVHLLAGILLMFWKPRQSNLEISENKDQESDEIDESEKKDEGSDEID